MKKKSSIVDAHLHFWDPRELTYPWLDHFPTLKRVYDVGHYNEETSTIAVDKMVFVQCECIPSQFKKEIEFVIENATLDKRIQAIVCWFPLHQQNVLEHIDEELSHPLIKGIRCLETSGDSLYKNATFLKNVKDLASYQLSFDLCSQAAQLPHVISLVQNCPDTWFMLDHMGKPNAPGVEVHAWKKNIIELSKYPHVYCKLSGIVPEAENKSWHKGDLKQYIDVALENFGIDRIVFGSDWPVVTLSSSFQEWHCTLLALCDGLNGDDLHKLLYDNACRFYRL